MMYTPIFSQASLESFNQFTNSYANLMVMMMQQNMEQVEIMRERLLASVQSAAVETAEVNEESELDSLRQQVKELEALREQVDELNRKYAVLENRTRSGRWNKTGAGHFKKT
ncbi:MAG: hypothetical protein Kow0031_22060 [Anaerolineae bacterium]